MINDLLGNKEKITFKLKILKYLKCLKELPLQLVLKIINNK